jgi:hypothetical protein
MDPINPWLDPAEVRRLAERLMKPSAAPMVPVSDAGFDDDFVGFAGVVTSSPAPPEMNENAVAGPPPVRAPDPEPEIPPTLNPIRGPFLERVSRFRDWMRNAFGASGVFLLDREGDVIFDEGGHGKLHLLARSLASAARRPGAPSGNVHVKVGAGATLEVIPVDTAYGCLILGAVVSNPLQPSSIAQVMTSLAKVASPPA